VDRPVIAPPGTTLALCCIQENVFFQAPKHIHCCSSQDLLGRLDDNAAKILCTIRADDQLEIQLKFSVSPLACVLDTKPPKGTVGFLAINIYGPKRLSDDVGYFMSQCGYYLEDPIGCDRNVPYINPQCLFSFYEQPPMTFDLSPAPQQSIHESTRSPRDILAGFETTDQLLEATTPSALSTTLQAYVGVILPHNLLTGALPIGTNDKHSHFSCDESKACIQATMALVYGRDKRMWKVATCMGPHAFRDWFANMMHQLCQRNHK
jgi:hypothetical protein